MTEPRTTCPVHLGPPGVRWLSALLASARDGMPIDLTDEDRAKAAALLHTLEHAFGDSFGELFILSSADAAYLRKKAAGEIETFRNLPGPRIRARRILAALGGAS